MAYDPVMLIMRDMGDGTSTSIVTEPPPVPAPGDPEMQEDFEGYGDGEDISGIAFSSGIRCIADSSESYAGTRSCRIGFVEGGTAGGPQRLISRPLISGDEIWVRFRAKWQSGWLFNASAGWKFVRIHTRSPSSTNDGYLDWYNSSSRFESAWYHRNEPLGGSIPQFGDGSSENVDPGVWHTYEMYVRFDSEAADDGGRGVVRFWRDGILLQELGDKPTLKFSESWCDRVHICTFFNQDTAEPYQSFDPATRAIADNPASGAGAPQDQYFWIDDMIIRTSDAPPSESDSDGHPFIGV